MATITFSVTSGSVTGSKVFTLTDASVTRWLNALRILLNAPSLTNAQVLAQWADTVITEAKGTTSAVERQQASKVVTDLEIS